MHKKKFWIKMLTVLIGTMLQGCYYDKFEKFKPVTLCDTTTTVTYSTTIQVILDRNCNTCHGGVTPSSGIPLDSYSTVKEAAVSGKLYSSLIWDGNASPMPKGSTAQIDTCTIRSIKQWIDNNYLP